MVFRRFIILMISLVFVNISLICHEINTQSENRLNGFRLDLVNNYRITTILIILYILSRMATLVIVKRYRVNTQTFRRIRRFLIPFSSAMAYIYMYFECYVFPDWTAKYRIEMHCTELIVFQMTVVLHTSMLNWKPHFFKVD